MCARAVHPLSSSPSPLVLPYYAHLLLNNIAHFRARACISPESPKLETTRSLFSKEIYLINQARGPSWEDIGPRS